LAGILVLFYSALLTLVIAALALRAALSMLRHPRHREGLGERFGRVRPDLAAAVAAKRVVWVHAVSVGEVLAASRLVKELGEALGEGWEIVVSTVTQTGQELARQRFGADHVFYTPIDFGFSVRAYLNALKPEAIVLIESGVWPRMMHECEKRGIPVMVANARVGDKSFKRALKMRGLWSRVLRRATLWLAQSEEDARRLVEMGVPAERVSVSGNLKYDIRAPKESELTTRLRKLIGSRPVVVAGSTTAAVKPKGHNDEEDFIVGSWMRLQQEVSEALLIVAPRHPERFGVIENYMYQIKGVNASELMFYEREESHFSDVKVLCLNTIGDLASVYSLASVAFVGGSLVKRGGHNPLEPAQFGVPVVMGSSFENFRDIVGKMQAADAISIVEDKDVLAAEFARLLSDQEAARAMGERGRKVFEEQQGATKRTVDVIVGRVNR